MKFKSITQPLTKPISPAARTSRLTNIDLKLVTKAVSTHETNASLDEKNMKLQIHKNKWEKHMAANREASLWKQWRKPHRKSRTLTEREQICVNRNKWENTRGNSMYYFRTCVVPKSPIHLYLRVFRRWKEVGHADFTKKCSLKNPKSSLF